MRTFCKVPGCNKSGQHLGKYRKDGSARYRDTCSMHHGLKYEIGRYEYLKHRKDYCENIDGRLGYTCTATIIWNGQLQVDHIDGNHNNNTPINLQTLCANCHQYKSFINKDWLDKTSSKFTCISM